MIFKDFSYQLHSQLGESRQSLGAKKAEIRDTPNLLWINSLNLHGGIENRSYSVTAPEATYDFRTGRLNIERRFQGSAFGMHFEGSRLGGEVKSRNFKIAGDFGIHLCFPLKTTSSARHKTWEQLTAFPRSPGLYAVPGLSPIGIVQDFAGDLTTFIQCWNQVAEDMNGNLSEHRHTSDLMIMGREGGRIDLAGFEIDLDGRTAILGPRFFLRSDGGLRIREVAVELDRMMRLSGGGGIQAWMAPSDSGITLICSDKFEFVGDRRILQFEGGPLTLSRGGIILKASENWQFIRVFDGGRVVLSPGGWNTLEALETSPY